MEYVRYASPIGNQRMVELNQQALLDMVINNPKKDHYASLYTYTESQKEEYDKTKSVGKMTPSEYTTNIVVFDFDKKDDKELALNDARIMYSKLLSLGFQDNDVQKYNSGGKGFHLVLQFNRTFKNDEVKTIVANLNDGLNLKTLDTQIYDVHRLFRLPFSYHMTSGNYKTPLSEIEFTTFSLNEIEELIKVQATDDRVNIYNNYNFSINHFPSELLFVEPDLDGPDVDLNDIFEVTSSEDKPDFSQKTKELTEAKYALQMGFFEDGERNQAFEILAATYKYLGYPKEFAHRMLKATDELYVKRMKSKGINKELKPKKAIWNENINHVYGPLYRGGTYSEKENPLLIKTIQRYNIKPKENDLITTTSLQDVFKKFATEIDKNTIKLGFDEIDKDIQITTSMLVYLLAAPSAGKSSITFSILNHASKNNLNTMFFSLDMGTPLVYQRLLQKHTGMSSKTIFNMYKNGDNRLVELNKQVESNYKNVSFCFRSGLTVDDIETLIQEQKNTTGESPKLIAIDYLECVTGPFASDQTANSAYIANRLKDIANKYECTVLLLVQPQKSAGDPSAELLSMRNVKGSSTLEQAASIILTLSRPGFDPKDPQNDKFAMVSVVKNRMGQLKTWDFSWNGLTGQIGSLGDEEREELKALRDKKIQEKRNTFVDGL